MFKKKICFILPGWVTKHTGGAELQCYLLSEKLIKNGWKIEVVTYGEKNEISNYKSSPLYNGQIDYFYYQKSKFFLVGFIKLFFILLKTRSFFYYNRTDARLMRGACSIYCRLFNKKFIYALAGNDELQKNFYSTDIYSRFFLFSLLKKLDAKITDLLIDDNEKKADLIICQTLFQQEQLKIKRNLNSIVIRNSIEIQETDDSFKKENIILWVGNLRPVKQPEVFFRLCSQLDIPEWKFVMIGNVGNYTKDVLNIDRNNFVFTNEIEYSETLEWFKKAKILINTSKEEGFSNTFIQAWLYNVLVISFNVDPDDLLKTGFGLFCNNNFDVLYNTVLENTQNFSHTDALRENAMKYAKNDFNLESNYNKFISAIGQLSEINKSHN